MPRRTKLIIAALFLVMLAIPAGYVAVTWSPANPLTFRVVPLWKSFKRPYGSIRRVGVRVENTSASTIFLNDGFLQLRPEQPGWESEGVGSIYPEYPAVRRRPGTRDFVEIPPRGSINVVAFVVDTHANDANAGRLQVTYVFMSSTKRRTTELGVWLYKLLPEKLSPKMPLPEMDRAGADLGAMTD